MSALARYFHARKVHVSGYDRTPTPLTRKLEESGINIHYEDNIDLIPKDADIVVYTPAIPADQKELSYYRQHGYKVVKRSDVLQWITENSFNICVAGTHGKTTITTMVAHILRYTGYGCNAFLGGISANYQTNFWSSERNVCVVEADEYDRSFLKLVPDIAVISAMDADHLDIYGTAEEVEKAFIQFAKKIKKGGCLVSKHGMHRSTELKADFHYSYSFNDTAADVYAADIKVEHGGYRYDVVAKSWIIKNVILPMGGLHNIENSVAAITIAMHLHIDEEKIKGAVAAFKGVKRRFEYIVNNDKHVLIDDYAHHPEELRALITGVRSLFPKQKCTLVFQPHLYSRTNDQADGFAEVLSMADEVILLPIYPARELPIPGVSSEMIKEKMKHGHVVVLSKEHMITYMQQNKPGLIVMSGAGDIDALVPVIKDIISA